VWSADFESEVTGCCIVEFPSQSDPSEMKPKRGKSVERASQPARTPILLPALILLIALVFRTVSLNTFAPLVDERITRDVVAGIWHGQWSNNWKYTVSDESYHVDMYNFSSYLYADGLIAGALANFTPPLSNGRPDYVWWSRLFSALAGTFAVYLFYLVARRLFGQQTAILAMILIALMPLLIQDSHYARPEAFVLVLIAAAYLFLLRFDADRDRPICLGYAGFCFGLLIACKISMLPMVLLPVLFLARLKDRRQQMRAIGICAVGTLLGAFVGVPDAFFHPKAYWHGVQFLREQYASGTRPHASIDSTNSIALTAAYFWQTTKLLLLFSLAGALVLARTRRFVLLAAIAGPVVFYLAYFCLQRTFFERNLSHVAPLMAILAAIAITAAGEKLVGKTRIAVLSALLVVAAAPAAWVSGKLVFVAMREIPDLRAVPYEIALQQSLRHRIDGTMGLFTEGQLDTMLQTAKAANRDVIIRITDYHDGFTRKHLDDLERRTNWREIGYFPDVFPDYDVSTLVAYHATSFRYLMLHVAPPAR
jgi:Dolichyl-phosphate-mannose-protein mannosyltransferase